jgi:hypothetical protein
MCLANQKPSQSTDSCTTGMQSHKNSCGSFHTDNHARHVAGASIAAAAALLLLALLLLALLLLALLTDAIEDASAATPRRSAATPSGAA